MIFPYNEVNRMKHSIDKNESILIDVDSLKFFINNMDSEITKSNNISKQVFKSMEQTNKELIGSITQLMDIHQQSISRELKESLDNLKMDKINNIENCKKCKNSIKGYKDKYNKLEENVNKLKKEKEEIAMLTKYKMIPYVIFFFISSSLLAVFTTLHVVWRITGLRFVNPVTSFMVILMSIGWTLTAFVGLIHKRKESF